MTRLETSDTASLRNVALVGASATGKTTLAEALMVRAGALKTAGSVERGTTLADFDVLEKRVQHSLYTSVLHCEHDGARIQLLDTPGAPEFAGQSLPALEAVETAAVVINAAAGVDPTAVRMLAWAAERGLDRLVVVNRIDAQGVDLKVMASLGEYIKILNRGMLETASSKSVALYKGQHTIEDVVLFLVRHGFEIERLTPNDVHCNEVNVIYKRIWS